MQPLTLDSDKKFSITAGAFCRARKKLLHTAYVELNDDIIGIYYKDNDIKRFKGYRLLAFDGSKITLPNTKEIKKEFESKPIGNQTDKELGEYTRATYQACYDALNNIAVQSSLGDCNVYEVDLAEKMIDELKSDDLSIFDRGYASYLFMASLIKHKKPFIIRYSTSTCNAAKKLFDPAAPESVTVSIDVPASKKKKARGLELPAVIQVRFVKIILSTEE